MAQLMPPHSLSLASVKSRLVLPFWYRLTWVVPEKGPLNGTVCVCNSCCYVGCPSYNGSTTIIVVAGIASRLATRDGGHAAAKQQKAHSCYWRCDFASGGGGEVLWWQCSSVCPREYLRNYNSDLHYFFMHVSYVRGSILLWRRCDMLCTGGSMTSYLHITGHISKSVATLPWH